MTANVRYLPENRDLDLANLTAKDYDLIIGLHGSIRHGNPVLICLLQGGGEMYIKRTAAGKYFAAHFPGGAHGDHPVRLESVGHQRQKEYWARAAEANGLLAAIELPVPGGRLDVAITGGPVPTDIEIQRHEIKVVTVKSRTTTYRKAGYLPVWFNDWGPRPLWLNEVPALGCVSMPWAEVMPEPRTVTATGLTAVQKTKCVIGAFPRGCPDGRRRPCGRYHPKPVPWIEDGRPGLSVDAVAGLIPAGEIQPLRDRDGMVYLVSRADFAVYQDITDGLGEWQPSTRATPTRPRSQQVPEPCRYPEHNAAESETLLFDSLDPDVVQQISSKWDVPRQRRLGLTATAKPGMCPDCGTAKLLPGREVCQACIALRRLGMKHK